MQQNARRVLILLGLGAAVFLVTCLAGVLINWAGGDGEVLSLPLGQAAVLLALVCYRHLGLLKIDWGAKVLPGILTGFVAIALAAGATWGWCLLLEAMGYAPVGQTILQKITDADAIEFALIGVIAGIFGPFIEEVYFRGWWQPVAKHALPVHWAIAVVALIFAVLHLSFGLLPGLFVAGVCFGYAAERWGLTAAVAAHIVFNCVTIFAARAGAI